MIRHNYILHQTEVLYCNVIGPRLTPLHIFPLQEERASHYSTELSHFLEIRKLQHVWIKSNGVALLLPKSKCKRVLEWKVYQPV